MFIYSVKATTLKFAAVIGAAVISLGHIQNGVLAAFIGTAVMGRERVDLRDAGHKGHDG